MSVNHKLYNKIINSKNINEAIENEEKKLYKKITNLSEENKKLTDEGFFSLKFYLLFSQLVTLNTFRRKPNLTADDIVNAGELWSKLYVNFLKNKYKNITTKQIISIIKKDANII